MVQMDDTYQLATHPLCAPYIEKLISPQTQKSLSHASLEVLAIVAYQQPITKAQMEEIRGVKSDQALRTLLDKQLIEDKGRLEKVGRPIVYGTTLKFLKHFGITSLEELPAVEELSTDSTTRDSATRL